jgi:hypothetical protein
MQFKKNTSIMQLKNYHIFFNLSFLTLSLSILNNFLYLLYFLNYLTFSLFHILFYQFEYAYKNIIINLKKTSLN